MKLFSKESLLGYFKLDHRESPGIPNMPFRAKGQLFETSTITCSHCEKILILNPNRTRERAFCPKCDKYICDECEAIRVQSGGNCKPFKQVIDEILEKAAKINT